MDEPQSNPSSVPLYFLAKLAREHVTVVLSGEGADEIFAGYEWYADTEVLVHGYEEWGTQLVYRLRGMYGFVIWDKVNRRLFEMCIRDSNISSASRARAPLPARKSKRPLTRRCFKGWRPSLASRW